MDNAVYVSLGRLHGLKSEMQVIANNIANVSTPGYKREGIIFSEHVAALEDADSSLSMATADLQRSDFTQGGLTHTGGDLDFAIDGEGFFLVEHTDGQALTRAGNFAQNADGELVTATGHRVLDAGGAAIFVPPDARAITLSSDGTLSADGNPITQLGVFAPAAGDTPRRIGQSLFAITQAPVAVETPTLLQGVQEDSNVNAILEVARMIEVHRAYERGAKLNSSEDERIRTVLRTLGTQ